MLFTGAQKLAPCTHTPPSLAGRDPFCLVHPVGYHLPESGQAGLSPAKEREETLLISLSCRLNPSHHQLLYGPFNAILVCETGEVFWEALEKVFLIERHLRRKERSLFSAPPISV